MSISILTKIELTRPLRHTVQEAVQDAWDYYAHGDVLGFTGYFEASEPAPAVGKGSSSPAPFAQGFARGVMEEGELDIKRRASSLTDMVDGCSSGVKRTFGLRRGIGYSFWNDACVAGRFIAALPDYLDSLPERTEDIAAGVLSGDGAATGKAAFQAMALAFELYLGGRSAESNIGNGRVTAVNIAEVNAAAVGADGVLVASPVIVPAVQGIAMARGIGFAAVQTTAHKDIRPRKHVSDEDKISALERFDGNRTRAAESLGIHLTTITHGIDRAVKRLKQFKEKRGLAEFKDRWGESFRRKGGRKPIDITHKQVIDALNATRNPNGTANVTAATKRLNEGGIEISTAAIHRRIREAKAGSRLAKAVNKPIKIFGTTLEVTTEQLAKALDATRKLNGKINPKAASRYLTEQRTPLRAEVIGKRLKAEPLDPKLAEVIKPKPPYIPSPVKDMGLVTDDALTKALKAHPKPNGGLNLKAALRDLQQQGWTTPPYPSVYHRLKNVELK